MAIREINPNFLAFIAGGNANSNYEGNCSPSKNSQKSKNASGGGYIQGVSDSCVEGIIGGQYWALFPELCQEWLLVLWVRVLLGAAFRLTVTVEALAPARDPIVPIVINVAGDWKWSDNHASL